MRTGAAVGGAVKTAVGAILARRVGRLLLGPAMALAIVGGFALTEGTASAAPPYGPTATCTIALSTSVTTPGSTIGASGNCGLVGNFLTFTISSDPTLIGTTIAGTNGAYAVSLTIPSSESLGQHVITVHDGILNLSASATITLVSSTVAVPTGVTPRAPTAVTPSAVTPSVVTPSVTPTAPSSGLAFTGTDAALVTAVGAGAIGAGGLLVLSSRKRRRNNWSS